MRLVEFEMCQGLDCRPRGSVFVQPDAVTTVCAWNPHSEEAPEVVEISLRAKSIFVRGKLRDVVDKLAARSSVKMDQSGFYG
jgi:hypothetical protein